MNINKRKLVSMDVKTRTVELKKRLEDITNKYDLVIEILGKKYLEEIEVARTLDTAKAFVSGMELDCTVKDWIDMNNSLLMSGMRYDRPDGDLSQTIDDLVMKFINGKIDEKSLKETVLYEAIKAGIRDTDKLLKEVDEKLDNVKKELKPPG